MMIPEDVPNLTIKIWSHKCQKAAERIVIKIKGVAVDFLIKGLLKFGA